MKLLKKILYRMSYNYRLNDFKKNGMKVGDNVHIYNSIIDHSHYYLISIGNNVTITNSSILAHDASTKNIIGKSIVGKVTIGDNVFIGYKSIILPNVKIGDNVIIGAGSVVTRDIPSNSIAVGNPCKVIAKYDEFVRKHHNLIKEKPIYHSKEKTKKDKLIMQVELENTFGYDE